MTRGARRLAIAVAKTTLGALVLLAVARHVGIIWEKLPPERRSIRVDPSWIALSGALYLAGLFVFGLVFHRVLSSGAGPAPGVLPTLRAYIISHLGKYVPGKALVVVMRVALLRSAGGRASTVTFASFYETLVMMAAGGLLAAGVFAAGGPASRTNALVALGVGLGFLTIVLPWVFPRLSRVAALPFPRVGDDAIPVVGIGRLAETFAFALLGWGLWGLSQVALVCGVGGGNLPVARWPTVVASVAFATVAGFLVALLPGGLGVREGILIAVLGPAIGETAAIVAALGLRLVWISVELLSAAVLYPLRPRPVDWPTPP